MNRFFVFFLVLFALSSCGLFSTDYDSFTVKNESNHTLDLVYFTDSYPIENGVDTITIEKDSSYIIYEGKERGLYPYLEFLSTSSDSMKVIFDKEKFLFYYGWTLDSDSIFAFQRSPMNREFYDLTKERKHGSDYTYTITEEDYKKAESIIRE